MISHHHKTVFVHVPKCGGQSIEAAFLSDLGLDWERRAPLLLRPNDVPAVGPPRLAHLTAREYLDFRYLSPELFAAYFSFTVVRSPYARVVSLFNYGRRKGTLSGYVQKTLVHEFERAADYRRAGHGYEGNYWFCRPQVDYITDAEGATMVDAVYRLEELGDILPDLRERSGLEAAVEHKNKSTPKARLGDLTDRDREVIRDLYAADFERLGYDA